MNHYYQERFFQKNPANYLKSGLDGLITLILICTNFTVTQGPLSLNKVCEHSDLCKYISDNENYFRITVHEQGFVHQ